jgi:hypothetical protein
MDQNRIQNEPALPVYGNLFPKPSAGRIRQFYSAQQFDASPRLPRSDAAASSPSINPEPALSLERQ